MRTGFSLFLLLALCFVGCEEDPTVKRDIVLEIAAANQDLFESPKTRAGKLYSRYCSVCHGINGQGDGFNAFNLDPKPRNFTDSVFKARMDTILIKEVISGGGGVTGLSRMMPMWGNTLSERDISELADFVVHLATQQSQ
jgi:mono/diheme cytochrome c family protein